MTASVDHVKVRSEHQERLVFVDVRQSSARQVRNHLESQRLQYEFAEQAIAMGWARERIIVLDEDQGRCAALPNARGGFGEMVVTAARGEVGIVMSFELSRLSRSDLDWHQLVYLCRWTGTLIAAARDRDPTASPAARALARRRASWADADRPAARRRTSMRLPRGRLTSMVIQHSTLPTPSSRSSAAHHRHDLHGRGAARVARSRRCAARRGSALRRRGCHSAMVPSIWEDTMPRQISFDLHGEGRRALWSRLPERWRREAVAIWTQIIATAARGTSSTQQGKEENR